MQMQACRQASRPRTLVRAQGLQHARLQGFDGSTFEFRGVPGNWYEVLGSKQPSMSLKTQVGRGGGCRLCEEGWVKASKQCTGKG